jgi:RsiW-degrading membrane proteinase PrsW (M82 family)
MDTQRPSKFYAYVAVLIGGFLTLSGLAAVIAYLGLPLLAYGNNVLSQQLGQMAAMFLGLICGPLVVYHGFKSIRNATSRQFKLPPFYFFWIVFAVILGLGNLVLNFRALVNYIFPMAFLLGAALPTLAVVAYAGRKLGWPVTWRQAALAFVGGSTLSILVAIIFEVIIGFAIYFLLGPWWYYSFGFDSSDGLSRWFFSPTVIFFLFITALTAPIPEEFAKALGLPLFGRRRIVSAPQALFIGLISGAGFAILENMLYEGIYAQYNGWAWGGVTLLRGLGAALHTLCTAIVALGWYRMKDGGVMQLLKAYGLAVGLHTLWNGGFDALVYVTGIDYYSGYGVSLNVYGSSIPVLLVIFLIALALGLWWYLRRIVTHLTEQIEPEAAPTEWLINTVPARFVASWAIASVWVVVPIGVAVNGAWPTLMRIIGAR